jgi:hypothetical protein
MAAFCRCPKGFYVMWVKLAARAMPHRGIFPQFIGIDFFGR